MTIQTSAMAMPDQSERMTPESRRAIFSASFGTFVEYYDFIVYGFLATILAGLFFPGDDPVTSLLITFGAYAVSYFVRPLGAILISPIGDIYGRKALLLVVIALMTLPTAAIGLLPTYHQIGILAPILLTLCRVLQGLSAGAEYGGASALVVEYAPARQRGYYSGYLTLTISLAMAVGMGLGLFITKMTSTEVMQSWGWRVPFLLALPLGLIGLYIRLQLEETPVFQKVAQKAHDKKKTPLRTTVQRDWRAVLLGMSVGATHVITASILFLFVPTHLIRNLGYPPATAMSIALCGLLVWSLFMLPMAALTDRWGRKPVAWLGSLGLMALYYPVYLAFGVGPMASYVAIMVAAPFASMASASLGPMFAEMFKTDNRSTGINLGWQFSTLIFGGPAPMIAMWLIGRSGNTNAPALFAMSCICFTLFALCFIRETKGIDLSRM
ncbi:MFS transporter [Paracoccus sp. pheM1]|uniref:MFS transporter n=1 Tax=Paracoccus sp. pheM1 TaxID=2831675 RepID=UPI001BDB91EF|nr:MFS transporter [Paracoccus sp. pheM1]MBT0782954.1 MFS transporter [Paracoccus sp. pheM1]